MTERSVEGEPLYLSIEDVLTLYAEIFHCSEREALDQLRDKAGLESALARPRMYTRYQNADLALQAAVLAHGIAEGQYFVDGNKRTALAACLTFLRVNGHDVTAPQATKAEWILELSRAGRLKSGWPSTCVRPWTRRCEGPSLIG